MLIYSSVLDAWSGPEDRPFFVPGLTGDMTTRLPFTIYDPELMSEWAFGVPWAASTIDHAHEVGVRNMNVSAPRSPGGSREKCHSRSHGQV